MRGSAGPVYTDDMKRTTSSHITTEQQLDAHLANLRRTKQRYAQHQRRLEYIQDWSVVAMVVALALVTLYWQQLTHGQPQSVVYALDSARRTLMYVVALSAVSYALRRIYRHHASSAAAGE